MVFNGFCFFVAERAETDFQFVEIYFVSVKFRSVNAGEFGFASDGDAAGSAHAHTVNHK